MIVPDLVNPPLPPLPPSPLTFPPPVPQRNSSAASDEEFYYSFYYDEGLENKLTRAPFLGLARSLHYRVSV